MPTLTFGAAIVELLTEHHGVDTVFGIPGVHTIELYRGVAATGVRSIVPRHEQGAGFMADGYGRISGKPGVCLLVSGPGLLNALTPIAQAWHDSQPMLVIAATTASADLGRGVGPLHDIPDQAGLVRQLTSISEVVDDPHRFAELVGEAWYGWATSRPRPVHLAIPTDLLARTVRPIAPCHRSVTPPTADTSAIDAAVGLLDGSRATVIVAGGGALGAAGAVRALAERLDAPVVTTGNAKGLLPADHPLCVGTLLAFAPVLAMIGDADVLVAIGTELSAVERLTTGASLDLPATVIRIDIDATQFERQPATVGIGLDAATAVALLLERITATTADGAARAGAARNAVVWPREIAAHLDWLTALDDATPAEAIVALDSTQLAYSAQHVVPWSSPGTWLAPYGLGTLGPALPMAIGARVARPDAPVLALAGDGGSLFTLPELATAVDLQAPLTLVVWDNAGYGEIRDSFDRAGAPRSGTETTAHDLVAIAAGFGCHAERVDEPAALATALTASWQRPGVSVVVATDPARTPHQTGDGG